MSVRREDGLRSSGALTVRYESDGNAPGPTTPAAQHGANGASHKQGRVAQTGQQDQVESANAGSVFEQAQQPPPPSPSSSAPNWMVPPAPPCQVSSSRAKRKRGAGPAMVASQGAAKAGGMGSGCGRQAAPAQSWGGQSRNLAGDDIQDYSSDGSPVKGSCQAREVASGNLPQAVPGSCPEAECDPLTQSRGNDIVPAIVTPSTPPSQFNGSPVNATAPLPALPGTVGMREQPEMQK